MIVIIIFRYHVVLFYTFSIFSWLASQAFSDGLLSPKAFSNGLLSPQIHFQIHQLIVFYQYKHGKNCIWPYAVVNKVLPLETVPLRTHSTHVYGKNAFTDIHALNHIQCKINIDILQLDTQGYPNLNRRNPFYLVFNTKKLIYTASILKFWSLHP